jgi:hypothetical protein
VIEIPPAAKRPSELPAIEAAVLEPAAQVATPAPAVAALEPEVIPSVPPPAVVDEPAPALATAPTLLDAPRVAASDVPAEPEAQRADTDPPQSIPADAGVSSQPSGAHPVFRLPVERAVNTPLVRARAITCGQVVSYACTNLSSSRLPQASIAPAAVGSRESA